MDSCAGAEEFKWRELTDDERTELLMVRINTPEERAEFNEHERKHRLAQFKDRLRRKHERRARKNKNKRP